MKRYTEIYMKAFDYGIDDFIPSELGGKQAQDIHHIVPRSQRKDLENNIENLMALTREQHEYYGDKKQYKEMLKNKHKEFLDRHRVEYNENLLLAL